MTVNGPESCILVIFGASGDLTRRKLIPALYELARGGAHGKLPERFAVVGVARTEMSDDEFRRKMKEAVRDHAAFFDEALWNDFAPRLHYHTGDGGEADLYPGLSARLCELGAQHGLTRPEGTPNLLFYLSVAPKLYEPIIEQIGASGLVSEGRRWCSINPGQTPWQRIIVEKPFGHDASSASALNMALGRVFEEESIYRIDHYLGKELVQNILVMRFGNTIFEPIWNRTYIDHVQVTAAETLGVGSRAAGFYDSAGALRDMIQSHLLQVLGLVTMEPPGIYDTASIMREKIKLFNSAKITPVEVAHEHAALGRYGPAPAADGRPAEPAYAEEQGVDASRKTETFAAIRVQFDNWRWAGVPIYLRSGKKLARKLTEIVVQFRRPPVNMFRRFGDAVERLPANRLIMNIAPSNSLELLVQGKVPGSGLKIDSANLVLDYLERFGGEEVDAYGPLLLDAMRGDRTLFKHRDEISGTWAICQPFLDSAALRDGIETYGPRTWGPSGADALLAAEGRTWHNPPSPPPGRKR
jgi:glucose-6-phosphate 1-dehydrogenase